MSSRFDQVGSPESSMGFPDFGGIADRRSFIRSSLLAIGVAGVGLSGCKLGGLASGGEQFFSAARFAVLDAVSETIMPRTETPGARDAKVPPRLDRLMSNWASRDTQKSFTALLDQVEAAAKAQESKNLADLPSDKQLAVVAAFDKSKMTDPAYMKFKNLVLSLYYISEPGATQELAYEHVPGAWEPSIPVTPETRAYAFDISV
jgi:gluconate 2-dehydrogenase gamma chain